MRQAEDLVWSAITESAKSRFDYPAFKNSLSEAGDARVAEYILFQVIVGLAEELSDEEFFSTLRGDLALFGYALSEEQQEWLLTGRKKVFSAETRAAKEALAGFAQGRDAASLLAQIRPLLQ